MKVYINYEAFELIERKGSMTPQELAKHLGLKVDSAAAWLSRWAVKGYLIWVPDPYKKRTGRPSGRYKIGEKWWGELAFGVKLEQG